MSALSRYVLDTYDDYDGSVLRSVVADAGELPPFIKTAHRYTTEEIETSPDSRFALVMFDGATKMKKYAMSDRGNTALSVLYLLKQAHVLPAKAVKVAAANLLRACDRFNLDAPLQLKIAAATGVSGLSGKGQRQYAKDAKVNKAQYPLPETAGQYVDNPQLGNPEPDNDLMERTNYHGPQGTNFLSIPPFSQKETIKEGPGSMEKKASVDGHHWTHEYIQRLQGDHQSLLDGLFNGNAERKQQHWGDGQGVTQHIDVTGWNPADYIKEASAAPKETLLRGRYPIDSYDQVEKAAAYFGEYGKQMPPEDRHEYCVKLAHRMEQLGMDVPDDITRYGSTGYAADADSYIESRRHYVQPELHSALDTLIEKRASISPAVFVDALAEFDKLAGLNWHYGRIPDPYYSVFGPSLEKLAAEGWTWDEDGTFISEDDLKRLARNGRTLLEKAFRDDIVQSFMKNPKTVFESLPRPEKLVMARLAADKNAGTATE